VRGRRCPPVGEGELRQAPSLPAGSGREPTASARRRWRRSRVVVDLWWIRARATVVRLEPAFAE
jgi:hypothetical protein